MHKKYSQPTLLFFILIAVIALIAGMVLASIIWPSKTTYVRQKSQFETSQNTESENERITAESETPAPRVLSRTIRTEETATPEPEAATTPTTEAPTEYRLAPPITEEEANSTNNSSENIGGARDEDQSQSSTTNTSPMPNIFPDVMGL